MNSEKGTAMAEILDTCPACKKDISTTRGSLCFCSCYSSFWHKLSPEVKRESLTEIADYYTEEKR